MARITILGSGRFVPGRPVSSDVLGRVMDTSGEEVVRGLLDEHRLGMDDVDWFLAHQANDRINQAVRDALGVEAQKVPSNIAKHGNTSSATIPMQVDELRRDGKSKSGQLLCFMGLGAGLNRGAALLRL